MREQLQAFGRYLSIVATWRHKKQGKNNARICEDLWRLQGFVLLGLPFKGVNTL